MTTTLMLGGLTVTMTIKSKSKFGTKLVKLTILRNKIKNVIVMEKVAEEERNTMRTTILMKNAGRLVIVDRAGLGVAVDQILML